MHPALQWGNCAAAVSMHRCASQEEVLHTIAETLLARHKPVNVAIRSSDLYPNWMASLRPQLTRRLADVKGEVLAMLFCWKPGADVQPGHLPASCLGIATMSTHAMHA
jgi:hypothetical protein